MSLKDEKNSNIHKPDYNWLGRSLQNYKEVHATIAEDKGVGHELRNAKTLTQAKKVVFGLKRKNIK